MPEPSSSSLPFDSSYPAALAVYCSDGRFTEAVEELLRRVEHSRLDTLTVPGGPGLIDPTAASEAAVETAREAVSFLVAAHHTKHVTLLTHEGCGYYGHRFPHDSADARIARQLSDLRAAGKWVVACHPGVEVVHLFFARIRDGVIAFDPVDIDP